MFEVDVTLVATRRPDLLDLTLRSFQQNLFSRKVLQPRRLFLNIDPLWGTDADDAAVEALCRKYFPVVVVRRPEQPGFGAAVKWAWSQVESQWALHLEDDWLLARKISTKALHRQMRPDVGQIGLANQTRLRRRRKRIRSMISSPCVMQGEFARIAAQYMKPELDPEKQFYEGYNEEGSKAIEAYGRGFYGHALTPQVLFDTGRAWRDARGIEKKVKSGASTWITPSEVVAGAAQLEWFERRLRYSRYLPAV